MRAVITGATGFLGSRVAEMLVREGLDIVCLVRPTSQLNELKSRLTPQQWDRVTIVPVKLEEVDKYSDYFDSSTIVYHIAAALTGSTSALFMNTVIPTRLLVNACVEKRIHRFVLVSSMGIYGPQQLPSGTMITEESPLDTHPHQRDSYTYSKYVQEQVCREAFEEEKLPLVVIRPGVIFGPGRGIMSGRVGLKMGNLLVRMGGVQKLPYTYVDNCARAVFQAGIVPKIEGQVLNVVDDDLPNAKQIVREARRSGQRLRQVVVPRFLIHKCCALYEWYSRWSRGQLPPVLTTHKSKAMWKTLRYSNEKAKKLLEWRPEVPMHEAIRLSAKVGPTPTHP
jgi:nucleoside-diphosphate-sugar epimerase